VGADTGQGDDLAETVVDTVNLSEELEENGLLGMDPGWIRLLRSRRVNEDWNLASETTTGPAVSAGRSLGSDICLRLARRSSSRRLFYQARFYLKHSPVNCPHSLARNVRIQNECERTFSALGRVARWETVDYTSIDFRGFSRHSGLVAVQPGAQLRL
jgi:hypothetical protein